MKLPVGWLPGTAQANHLILMPIVSKKGRKMHYVEIFGSKNSDIERLDINGKTA
jgi:hypothetical protein